MRIYSAARMRRPDTSRRSIRRYTLRCSRPRFPSVSGALTIVAVAAAVVLVVVAVVYLTMSHPKHALLYFGLAVLALVGAWFSTGDSRLKP